MRAHRAVLVEGDEDRLERLEAAQRLRELPVGARSAQQRREQQHKLPELDLPRAVDVHLAKEGLECLELRLAARRRLAKHLERAQQLRLVERSVAARVEGFEVALRDAVREDPGVVGARRVRGVGKQLLCHVAHLPLALSRELVHGMLRRVERVREAPRDVAELVL